LRKKPNFNCDHAWAATQNAFVLSTAMFELTAIQALRGGNVSQVTNVRETFFQDFLN
jgi:hypothetical protein